MIVLCVDSDDAGLSALRKALAMSVDVRDAAAFSDGRSALAWAAQNRVDAAFLEIRLSDQSGLELAKSLRELHPKLPIVFCADSREHAFDAFQIHATGYLEKPLRTADVQREIDYLRGSRVARPLLRAQCFGSFEAYAHGVPLQFRRAKTKELLAYLIDRRGASVTGRELYALLWEGRSDERTGINYLHQLTSDLRRGLKKAGADAVLVHKGQGYSVDPALIDCDYYRFLDGEEAVIRRFTGEYMSNYSWSEYTCAYLQSKAGVTLPES